MILPTIYINRQHIMGNKQAIVCYGLDKENMLLI